MSANRRNSRVKEGAHRLLARLWQIRYSLFLILSYLILFGWLFSGEMRADRRPSEILAIPADPLWEKPDPEHWFGTTGSGADLFQLSRVAMATTMAFAVVVSALGTGLSFLFVMMFAFDPGERRFSLLRSIGSTGLLLPSMLVLVILAGGAGGSWLVSAGTLTVLIALHLSPHVAGWFEENEDRAGFLAGTVLGLSRPEMVSNRVVPPVLRRLIGVFALLIPVVALAEMALSFLGFAGGRLSCGDLVAFGQDVMIEAPWMTVGPGILASLLIAIFSLLGWLSSRALKTDQLPRWI